MHNGNESDLLINSSRTHTPESLDALLFSSFDATLASEIIQRCPGYLATRLVKFSADLSSLPDNVYIKDESLRFATKSFKSTGALVGVVRTLCEFLWQKQYHLYDLNVIYSFAFRLKEKNITLSCATDGNYGRAVAWAGSLFGCGTKIYVNGAISQNRIKAIEAYGGRVIQLSGSYETALRCCIEESASNGDWVVSDTAWRDCIETPRHVMSGYAAIFDEIYQQWPKGQKITHVFLQVGVGGLAGAAIASLVMRLKQAIPHVILVEPTAAACAFASLQAGTIIELDGSLETLAGGLACGRLSESVWPLLKNHTFAALKVDDKDITRAMKTLFNHTCPVISGESGCVGFAGLLKACENNLLRDKLRLNPQSQVLVINTEGATDTEIYHSILSKAG